MSDTAQRFSASLAKDAVYTFPGLRSFMEYRDLGIADATTGCSAPTWSGSTKEAAGDHDLHTTGLHRHLCDFQMFYALKGWIRFIYDDAGSTAGPGDCVLRAGGHRAQRAGLLRRPRAAGDLLARRAPDGQGGDT